MVHSPACMRFFYFAADSTHFIRAEQSWIIFNVSSLDAYCNVLEITHKISEKSTENTSDLFHKVLY